MAEETKNTIPKDRRQVDENSPEVRKAIEELRTLIQEEEGLHLRTNDRFILRHLYGAGFDVKKSFQKLQEFYKLKLECPERFPSKPIKEYKEQLEINTHYILPERDQQGRRVFIMKMGNIDTDIFTEDVAVVVDDLFLEAVLNEPETQKNGTLSITDMSGYSYRNLARLRPSNLKFATKKNKCCVVHDWHEHHIINTSMLMNAAVSLMFPFMDETTKDLVHFHYDDFASLHKHVNPEILPEEYGGTGPPLDYEAMRQRFLYDQEDMFLQCAQEGYRREN